MIMIFPYQPAPDQKNKLITHKLINEIDFTLFNTGSQYIMSAGPNLVVFDKAHEDMLGHSIDEAGLPKAIVDFIDDSITRTLNGRYINRITFWNNRSWYFHTHPIYADPKGSPVGALLITEPHNKPIMMQTNASFSVTGDDQPEDGDGSVAIQSSELQRGD